MRMRWPGRWWSRARRRWPPWSSASDGHPAADGSLDRPALAALAFADPAERAALGAITHPAIGARTAELMATARPDQIIVHDVPLLVENGLAPAYDLVVVVWAPLELRLARLEAAGWRRTRPVAGCRTRPATTSEPTSRTSSSKTTATWPDLPTRSPKCGRKCSAFAGELSPQRTQRLVVVLRKRAARLGWRGGVATRSSLGNGAGSLGVGLAGPR